jgi:hypothetical protein
MACRWLMSRVSGRNLQYQMGSCASPSTSGPGSTLPVLLGQNTRTCLIIPRGPQGVAPERRPCFVARLARTSGTVLRRAPCRCAFRAATRLVRDDEIGSGHQEFDSRCTTGLNPWGIHHGFKIRYRTIRQMPGDTH